MNLTALVQALGYPATALVSVGATLRLAGRQERHATAHDGIEQRQTAAAEMTALYGLVNTLAGQVTPLTEEIRVLKGQQADAAASHTQALADQETRHKAELARQQLEHDRMIARQAEVHRQEMDRLQLKNRELEAELVTVKDRLAALESKVGSDGLPGGMS